MTSHDLPRFAECFDGLARMLGKRLDDVERGRFLNDYFRALRSYPVEAVLEGAAVCAQRSKHFPRPVEWVEAMPRTDDAAHIPVLNHHDAAEWRDAEQRSWEGDPCGCDACARAGVSWQPTRFVPDSDGLGRDRQARLPHNGRVVTCGHWAHGAELAAYYRARGAFFAQADAAGFRFAAVGR